MKKKLITFALLLCTFGTMLFPGFSPRQTIAYATENAGKLNKKDVDIVKNQQFTLKILGGKKSDSVVFQVRDNDIVSITASKIELAKSKASLWEARKFWRMFIAMTENYVP